MADSNEANGWNQWSKHVLIELEKNHTEHAAIRQDLSEIQRQIAVLNVKAGLWGAVAGVIAGATPLLILLLSQFFS